MHYTDIVPSGSPYLIHRKYECPREKSLNENVVCGGIKAGEGN